MPPQEFGCERPGRWSLLLSITITSDYGTHDRLLQARPARGFAIFLFHTSARAHQHVFGIPSPVQAGDMNPSRPLVRRSSIQTKFRCCAWERRWRLCRLRFVVKRPVAHMPCSIVSVFPRCRIYRRQLLQQELRRVSLRHPVVRENCLGQTDRQHLLQISLSVVGQVGFRALGCPEGIWFDRVGILQRVHVVHFPAGAG